MKKISTLLLLFVTAFGLQAQNVTINLANGDFVSYTADQISSIEFNAEEEVLFHEFTGWITVSSGYFSDVYYGDQAVVKVYRKGEGYTCRFYDNTWGIGRFDITLAKGQINGTGTVTMDNHHGGLSPYEATMSGPMTAISINIPGVMGGTTILASAAPTTTRPRTCARASPPTPTARFRSPSPPTASPAP